MAAVTVSEKLESWNDDVKTLTLKLSNSPATGDTYDTNLDATDGRGAEFREILGAEFYQAANQNAANTKPSWNASTGVVTLGTITTTPATGTLVIVGK